MVLWCLQHCIDIFFFSSFSQKQAALCSFCKPYISFLASWKRGFWRMLEKKWQSEAKVGVLSPWQKSIEQGTKTEKALVLTCQISRCFFANVTKYRMGFVVNSQLFCSYRGSCQDRKCFCCFWQLVFEIMYSESIEWVAMTLPFFFFFRGKL